MPSIDKQWVISQMATEQMSIPTGNAVIALLKAWEDINLSIDDQKKAVEVFSKLSLGIPLKVQVKKDEVWLPARPGAIRVGDEVMVREDAFQSDARHIHNGRRGRVVAVRYGDIIVNSTDGVEPEISGAHYSPHHLLKLES